MQNNAFPKTFAKLIREFNKKGWSAATGTNYSYRDETNNTYWLSRSGIDKAEFKAKDFMLMDMNGKPTSAFETIKPSAENLIHLKIYQKTNAKVILHSHSVEGTILSSKLWVKGEKSIVFEGYEVQKALPGISTHDCQLNFPIFENDQDMPRFIEQLEKRWDEIEHATGFIIAKHGLYTWGENLFEAKRHLEAYEFLLTCYYKNLLIDK